jgi:hypothetical protein
MRQFLILFKHEFRMQFPEKKKGSIDIIGTALSLLITMLILGVFVYLLATVVDNYIEIKLYDDRLGIITSNPVARTVELLNVIYTVIIVALSAMMLEKMRSTLARQQDKVLFLRMPLQQQTIFLSKLATLLISNYITAFFLIIPINGIFWYSLKPEPIFWLYTAIIWLLLPMASFLIASVLLVPYIKIVEFVSQRYLIMFVLFTGAIVGAFLFYAEVLEIVQNLLETGSIKFLFDDKFISTLKLLIDITYPANCFAYIAVGKFLDIALGISGSIAVVSVFVVYFISKKLYYITLYKNESHRKVGNRFGSIFKTTKFAALIRKEFISVFRVPKNLFSYFAIATAMPVMVYSCYTLFESLIKNALGFNVSFALALIVILVFSILTNTFCATNVSRDGELALKVKMFPVRASKLLFAKVFFCSIVSTLSVIGSCALLYVSKVYFARLRVDGRIMVEPKDLAIIMAIGIVFSLSHIFVATRLDLNHAKVMASPQEIEAESNRTIAKTVFIGLILAIASGASSLLVTVFANTGVLEKYIGITLTQEYAYYLPMIIIGAYFLFSLVYYFFLIERKYRKLVR